MAEVHLHTPYDFFVFTLLVYVTTLSVTHLESNDGIVNELSIEENGERNDHGVI